MFGSVDTLAADDFPSRPIQIVVPFPPGAIDVYVRIIAASMAQTLSGPVIVENKSGANGFIGTQAVADAKPDGYTLLATATSSIVLGPLVSSNARFKVQRDFTPISGLYKSPMILVVRKSLPVKNLEELIAHGKANIGKLSYGSPGIGSAPHVLGSTVSRLLGLGMIHVPYRGFSPEIQDLLGGSLDMGFISAGTIGPHIRSGAVTAIAVDQGSVQPDFGHVPDLTKAIPEFESVRAFVGLWAPAGTPKPIVHRLNEAIVKALNNSGLRQRIAEEGSIPMGESPEEFAAEVDRNLALSIALIEAGKAIGAKFE